MEVVLIRHTSVGVPPGVCYGQMGVPLKPASERKAVITQENLKNYLPFDHVYASPPTCCIRLVSYCGCPDTEWDKRTMETNFGSWEVKPFGLNNDPRLQEWHSGYLNVATTSGKSFVIQYQHIGCFLGELEVKPYQRVVIFAHGGVLICARIYAGVIKPEEAFDALTPYGGIIRTTL